MSFGVVDGTHRIRERAAARPEIHRAARTAPSALLPTRDATSVPEITGTTLVKYVIPREYRTGEICCVGTGDPVSDFVFAGTPRAQNLKGPWRCSVGPRKEWK